LATDRLTAAEQLWSPTLVDKFGQYLSGRRIRKYAGDLRGRRVADLGCGYRALLVSSWLDEIESAYLVDLQLHADIKLHPKIKAIEGRLPVAAAELPTASLDLIVVNSVLEHVWEPQNLLVEVHRALVPSGIALVNVPNWRGKFWLELFAFRLGLSPVEEMEDHKCYYDVRDLWPLLVKAGFKPSRIRCFTHKFGLNTFAVLEK